MRIVPKNLAKYSVLERSIACWKTLRSAVLWLCTGNDNPYWMDYQRCKHLFTTLYRPCPEGIRGYFADINHDTGYHNGAYLALMATFKAHILGIPRGVAIFADLEPGARVDARWLIGWFKVITREGYTAGYYANPYAEGNFNRPFCAAVRQEPALAARAILDVYEPMLARSTANHAPLFTPSFLYCGNNPTGQALVWQYGLARGDKKLNMDTDEMKASVPLW